MSARTLKWVAMISMIVDHLAITLNTIALSYNPEPGPAAPLWYTAMRLIGRLAFPIFAFLVAEGCAHTRSMKRYLTRLAVFAALSQIPYMLFHNVRSSPHMWHYSGGNVLITLLCGALAAYCYQRLWANPRRGAWVFGIAGALIAPVLLAAEYDLCGVLIVLLCYALRPKEESAPDSGVSGARWAQALACGGVTLLYYATVFLSPPVEMLCATLGAAFALLYNGRAGHTRGKLAFYVFYPAHMLILAAVLYAYLWM